MDPKSSFCPLTKQLPNLYWAHCLYALQPCYILGVQCSPSRRKSPHLRFLLHLGGLRTPFAAAFWLSCRPRLLLLGRPCARLLCALAPAAAPRFFRWPSTGLLCALTSAAALRLGLVVARLGFVPRPKRRALISWLFCSHCFPGLAIVSRRRFCALFQGLSAAMVHTVEQLRD